MLLCFTKQAQKSYFASPLINFDFNIHLKAEFKGQIVKNVTVTYTQSNTYPVNIAGHLMLRGVTKEVQSAGTIKVEGDELIATSSFVIKVADYNIRIPSLVKDEVAKTVKITVDTKLTPLKG